MDIITTIASYIPYFPPDQRSNKWFLLGSPYPIFSILLGYLYFVLCCGPRYMKNHTAYELKLFIRLYNIIQIVANALIVYSLLQHNADNLFNISRLDRSPEGSPLKVAETFWWLLVLKLVDLVETGVFVLRKKNKQVSILHLYHHVSIVLLAWLTAKLYPGGLLAFHAKINSTVHVVMYSYYLVSSSGFIMPRFIYSLKKFVTIIQMAQFILLIIHALRGYYSNTDMPAWGLNLIITNLTLNFFLFFNFYIKNYISCKTQKSQ